MKSIGPSAPPVMRCSLQHSTTFVDQSRVDGEPYKTSERTCAAMVPLSCSRPPVSSGNQSPLFQLSQNISSGTSFDDARAVVAYVPKR